MSSAGSSESTDSIEAPRAQALIRREFGNLIWQVGADLHMDAASTATAALYFQRVFLVEKDGFDATLICMASLWLASKLCETKHRLRDIVNSVRLVRSMYKRPASLSMESYWCIRDAVTSYEQLVLRAMAFEVEPSLAHATLLEFAWMLRLGSGSGGQLEMAWRLLADSFASELCALHAGPRLALAALCLAGELARRVPHLQVEAEGFARDLYHLCREPGLRDYLGLGPRSGLDEIEAICVELLAVHEGELWAEHDGHGI